MSFSLGGTLLGVRDSFSIIEKFKCSIFYFLFYVSAPSRTSVTTTLLQGNPMTDSGEEGGGNYPFCPLPPCRKRGKK